ncbi:hypothetical protein HJC23_002211 [Cyclotella cryptica]|uniref:Ribosomal protein L9 domain-containing protein n=1 Tax=Cyclotella cryptica TaxID=29204 RepID=A0ABD3Q714_9STRA|eukprot:CCRYP_008233-RA/>CCRYP_008233-RA protein AED:0.08 eAED:0.08 QI:240/1/1/1/1/1/2/1655/247
MTSFATTSRLVLTGRHAIASISHHPPTQQTHRFKHSVRVILTRDLPEGQMRGVYAGEVHNVAAGYARNYLIPKKMAVYATPLNFERCGLVDPLIAEREGMKVATEEGGEDLKAADRLKKYLKNKFVRMIRNVDLNTPNLCHPGHVSAKHLRQKLSKQLKIDLEPHETIHIRNEPVAGLDEMDEKELMDLIMTMDNDVSGQKSGDEDAVAAAEPCDCDTKVKYLGDYVAKITLAGGYVVPLKFRIERR